MTKINRKTERTRNVFTQSDCIEFCFVIRDAHSVLFSSVCPRKFHLRFGVASPFVLLKWKSDIIKDIFSFLLLSNNRDGLWLLTKRFNGLVVIAIVAPIQIVGSLGGK